MLIIEDVSYRYKVREDATLKHVCLHAAKGEMLLLAGRSGCGKSTLIKAVSGLLNTAGAGELYGKIYLDGNDTAFMKPEEIGILVGTVYQSPDDQLFAMTVADEVGFALENQGIEETIVNEEVSRVLQRVGLKGFEKNSIHTLSGGQRQRLALASVLITKPKLLVLDEPVSQMNPQGVEDFLNLLVSLNREDEITIIVVEHRVNELARYFPRLAVMFDGEFIYDGPTEMAWEKIGLAEKFGLREPQRIKLCRYLNLTEFADDTKKIIELINNECDIDNKQNFTVRKKRSQECVVKGENIIYRYPGAKSNTLHGLNFEFYKGERIALMGFNGAGKSTLVNLLGGLTYVTSGCLKILQGTVAEHAHEIGYLRQEPDLMLLADSVWEELTWKNTKRSEKYLWDLLNKLNLENNVNDFPLALSKGQRLRVVLGALLAREPKLLLLDEPTTGQDQQSLEEIKNLINDFAENHGCILFCTHDIELASEIADRVIVMADGMIIADGVPEIVLADRVLLKEGGLIVPPLLDVAEALLLPECITVEGVGRYVSKAVVGRL
ncbi:MAG TPA: ATP-binding cassette domain-containing protein [Phascolarctobacterium faecium]|uniref:ABC transporter ATP-binding protein n=2 Tax=Phascolarctobacterium faecium TaxID=33025 RepID=UPI0024312A92|nr:ABC transporter ATP-binding protein [Phascolarctobacterium faecium]HJI09315.1 ATP-binding cassette domain-containing protein [Phascolarctobacterium faecium]